MNEQTEIVSVTCPQCGAPVRSEGQRASCTYCGASLIRRHHEESGESGDWGIHLKKVTCIDNQGTGTEAFRLLIPRSWELEGGVTWLMNNPGMPAEIAFRAFNPDGSECFEVFPNIVCYWTNNLMVRGFFPEGSLYLGSEVRPPAPVLQVLKDLVIPRYRGNVTSLKFVQEENLPDLVEQVRAGRPVPAEGITSAEGGRVRIRYHADGQELEEDLFGVVEIAGVGMPTMMGVMEIMNWTAGYLFSFRALAGQLDRLGDQFTAIVRSFRLNPAWFNRFMQVSQFLVQNQIRQIQHAGQISQIISQTNNEISDMIMSSYEQRQSTMDHISDQFSQAIRGVDAYQDRFQDYPVELPGGYNHAWSNALGEYIVTNDPSFDPNLDSNLDWEKMKRT